MHPTCSIDPARKTQVVELLLYVSFVRLRLHLIYIFCLFVRAVWFLVFLRDFPLLLLYLPTLCERSSVLKSPPDVPAHRKLLKALQSSTPGFTRRLPGGSQGANYGLISYHL